MRNIYCIEIKAPFNYDKTKIQEQFKELLVKYPNVLNIVTSPTNDTYELVPRSKYWYYKNTNKQMRAMSNLLKPI